MTKLICKGCGYRIDSSKASKKCPYCSKESLEEEKGAEELLEEVDNIIN